ncbi:AbrB/MazE/SpoVT family DNA-binding domain-containing protein [Sphingomonas sp. GV3]|uniref:AbrB/MazE/SpoVT family DNA-binding domain-containing protein n=1 Tax=Sphingomonas sp. GV3 TaxID=3040671 RepID=UPI00280B1346|nr:AbrB/MazE/SpoVT family DNA-binding domain-containing protein [Sphingomonas sp. GV3]
MGFEVTMSSDGQIIIPKDVRDALDLHSGETLSIHREGRRIVLEPTVGQHERISYEEFRRRVPRYEGPVVVAEDMTSRIGELFQDWKD